MRMNRFTATAVVLALVACDAQREDPTAFTAELDVAFSAAHPHNAVTPLSGDEEVPAVSTGATGLAKFQRSPDGLSVDYRLNVANIVDVLQSHIHIGPPGVNGPVTVFLYPSAPPAQLIPGRTQGTLMAGTFTAADLRGPLAGQTIADLWAHIEAGNAYVNVHTLANPPGEIRGQLSAPGSN